MVNYARQKLQKKSSTLDCASAVIVMVDEHAINHPELTPNQVWIHVKETLDEKSNDSWIGKNDAEVRNRVKFMRYVMLGKDLFRMMK